MGLTPLDVENAKFRSSFNGYNRLEVDQFMLRVSQALEEQLSAIQHLKQQVASLEGDVVKYRESEELLKNSVMLAQKTCDDLIAVARQKAGMIHDEALAEGDKIKQEFAELRSQREQFEYAFHGLLTGFVNRLEQGNPALNQPEGHQAIASANPPVDNSAPDPQTGTDQADIEESSGFKSVGSVMSQDTLITRPVEQTSISAQKEVRPARVEGSNDRDQDFSDFNAAISSATPDQAGWPETELLESAVSEAAAQTNANLVEGEVAERPPLETPYNSLEDLVDQMEPETPEQNTDSATPPDNL